MSQKFANTKPRAGKIPSGAQRSRAMDPQRMARVERELAAPATKRECAIKRKRRAANRRARIARRVNR